MIFLNNSLHVQGMSKKEIELLKQPMNEMFLHSSQLKYYVAITLTFCFKKCITLHLVSIGGAHASVNVYVVC